MRDQIGNINWTTEKANKFQENICFIDYVECFTCVDNNCLLRNLSVGHELHMEQWTGSKLGKGCVKAVYCHLAYLTYMQSTSCEMPAWMKHKLEIKIARRNIVQMIPL